MALHVLYFVSQSTLTKMVAEKSRFNWESWVVWLSADILVSTVKNFMTADEINQIFFKKPRFMYTLWTGWGFHEKFWKTKSHAYVSPCFKLWNWWCKVWNSSAKMDYRYRLLLRKYNKTTKDLFWRLKKFVIDLFLLFFQRYSFINSSLTADGVNMPRSVKSNVIKDGLV